MNRNNRAPRRGHGGPQMVGEKAKDFKSAVKRLIRELNSFKVLIIVALFLAAAGSVLSIFTPNILSDLTDEISKGLVVKQDNLKELTTKVGEALNEENISKSLPDVLSIDISFENISNIMEDSSISEEDKQKFQEILQSVTSKDASESSLISNMSEMPDSILNYIFKTTTYNGVEITSSDKIEFVRQMKNADDKNMFLPESIMLCLLNEIEIDNVKVSAEEQVKFITSMKDMDKDASVEELYKKIDEAPKSIQNVVEPFMDIDKIKNITILLVTLHLISAIFNYIESISMTTVSINFARRLRGSISKKINKLPL